MVTAAKKITAAEFRAMDLGDGLHELVRGEIVELTPPEYRHGYICGNIYTALRNYGQRTGHGHAATNDSCVDVSDDTVRGADVAYYSEARWPRERVGQEPAPVPPDLVAEVASASDRPGKVLEKVADYLTAGIPMVWVVYPRRRIVAIYRHDDPTPTVLTDDDAVVDLPELPGFACPVADFFA